MNITIHIVLLLRNRENKNPKQNSNNVKIFGLNLHHN